MARRQEWQKEDPAPAEGDDGPYDTNAVRTRIAIKLARFAADDEQLWRRCPVGVCRRKRACSAPEIACNHLSKPQPPVTDAQANADWARFQAALVARVRAWKSRSRR